MYINCMSLAEYSIHIKNNKLLLYWDGTLYNYSETLETEIKAPALHLLPGFIPDTTYGSPGTIMSDPRPKSQGWVSTTKYGTKIKHHWTWHEHH